MVSKSQQKKARDAPSGGKRLGVGAGAGACCSAAPAPWPAAASVSSEHKRHTKNKSLPHGHGGGLHAISLCPRLSVPLASLPIIMQVAGECSWLRKDRDGGVHYYACVCC